jgi:hypothetical protein
MVSYNKPAPGGVAQGSRLVYLAQGPGFHPQHCKKNTEANRIIILININISDINYTTVQNESKEKEEGAEGASELNSLHIRQRQPKVG